jgi:superoxide reductase
MKEIGQLFQTGDFKNEKHVPVIEAPQSVKADDFFEVKVSMGKEVSHPNTTEHHIRWIQLYFKPDNDKFSYEVGNFEFTAHGESVAGADQGPVYTDHSVKARMKIKQPGVLFATSYCNIHGLWQNAMEIKIT